MLKYIPLSSHVTCFILTVTFCMSTSKISVQLEQVYTSFDYIWSHKVSVQKYNLKITFSGKCATLILVYVQNFNAIRATISFVHIWA